MDLLSRIASWLGENEATISAVVGITVLAGVLFAALRSLVRRRGKGPATFDFLGFTMYWERSRWGKWRMGCKTRSARLRRAVQSVHDWCRRHRHLSIKDQHAALARRLRGHFNYFGVNGNLRSLKLLVEATKRIWYKWLNRRSQRSRLTWERFHALLERFPLPRPRITVQIWGT